MAQFDRTIATDAIVVADVVVRATTAPRSAADSVSVIDSVSRALFPPLKASAVRALDDATIRVDFSVAVVINAALQSPGSYVVQPVSPGAALVVVQSVSLPIGQANPAFVELNVTEMTDANVYQLVIAGALVGQSGESPSPNPAFFSGIGRAPALFLVLAASKNQVYVQFTEVMKDNLALRNVANYIFDGGLVVTAITAVEGSRVTLATTDQTPGQLYNLTVRGIYAARISDSLLVSDVTSDPGAFPAGLMTEGGSPMTENSVYMTET